jgi:hypothetical protein
VVALIVGVVNEVPVPNEEPPVDAAYQFNVPALAVAPNPTIPESQRLPGVVVETLGVVFTVAITADLAEVHPVFVAST